MSARVAAIAGQRFEKLLVVKDTGIRRKSSRAAIWECLCDCGNTTFAETAELRFGKRVSCGCSLKTQFACSIPGCASPAKAKHLCNRHYKRAYSFVPQTSQDMRERFAMKTQRMPNGCLEWIGAKQGWGYGSTRLNNRTETTHRIAWILAHGSIPKGLYVLHKCDNPPCVEVSHLFLGTQKDNIHDAIAKGRIVPRRKRRVACEI